MCRLTISSLETTDYLGTIILMVLLVGVYDRPCWVVIYQWRRSIILVIMVIYFSIVVLLLSNIGARIGENLTEDYCHTLTFEFPLCF